MRIAMWSGPRNLSTAMMYSFAARGDCAVWDEPFYGAYLHQTGLDHPMRDQILAACENDASRVVDRLLGPIPGGRDLWYHKHMTQHMLPSIDVSFARSCTNVFLIRHPARVIASYHAKRELAGADDIGFRRQAELFVEIAQMTGKEPVVVDSTDIRANPKRVLPLLCQSIEIAYTPDMLNWPAGGHADDGVWAPHWYGAVHASTGFAQAEGPLPDVPPELQHELEEAMVHYESLGAKKIG